MSPEQVTFDEDNGNKLQPCWKNEPTVAQLKGDMDKASSKHSEMVAKVEKLQTLINGGKTPDTLPNKSKYKSRLIMKQREDKIPALQDPFLSSRRMFTLKPRTGDDVKMAENNQILLNYYWSTYVNKEKLMSDIAISAYDTSVAVVKSGWYSEEEEFTKQVEQPIYAEPEQVMAELSAMVQSGQMTPEQASMEMQNPQPKVIGTKIVEVKEMRLVANHPTHEVRPVQNVIIDPTCEGDIRKARFVVDIYELDYSVLMKNKQKTLPDGTTTGHYRNIDKIDFHSDNTENVYGEKDNVVNGNSFVFADKARKKVKVYEYWGYFDIQGNGKLEPIVATMIGDTMVRLEKNPFPHKKIPFAICQYIPEFQEIYGKTDIEFLEDNQEITGKMTRAALDITGTQAAGQKIVNGRLFDTVQDWEDHRAGLDVKCNPNVDPKHAIYKENVEPVSPSVFQMIESAQNDADSRSGSISKQSLSGSATGAQITQSAAATRNMSILRRISALVKQLARFDIVNAQVFARDEEVIRITDKEFARIKREDLRGEFDITVDIKTKEADEKTISDLVMLMQTNAASMDPNLAKMINARIMRLMDQPDLADQVEAFEPQQEQPDPVMEELKKQQVANAQLENQKLQLEIANLQKDIEEADSRIAERYSRAQENESDHVGKMAKAEQALASAEVSKSMKDKLDMEFVKEQSGRARQEKLEDMKVSEQSKLAHARMAQNATQRQTETGAIAKLTAEEAKLKQQQEINRLNQTQGQK
jgi:hypothetical protein